MGVLLGLGDVELAPARLREGLGERAGLLGRERDLDRQAGLVLGHRDDEEPGRGGPAVRRCPIEAAQLRVGQGVDELARPIRPEVGMDDRVAVAHEAVDPLDHRRPHELVVLAALVGRFDGGNGRRRALPHPVDDRVVALLDPLPPVVAIHGVVAPADRRDPGVGVGGGEPSLEVREECDRRAGRRVPAVEERMDAHRRNPLQRGQLGERDEVAVVGVDAARPDEADDVEATCLRGRAPPQPAAPAA